MRLSENRGAIRLKAKRHEPGTLALGVAQGVGPCWFVCLEDYDSPLGSSRLLRYWRPLLPRYRSHRLNLFTRLDRIDRLISPDRSVPPGEVVDLLREIRDAAVQPSAEEEEAEVGAFYAREASRYAPGTIVVGRATDGLQRRYVCVNRTMGHHVRSVWTPLGWVISDGDSANYRFALDVVEGIKFRPKEDL